MCSSRRSMEDKIYVASIVDKGSVCIVVSIQ
jgi:hypothetical protein